jgi:hypothetical protein
MEVGFGSKPHFGESSVDVDDGSRLQRQGEPVLLQELLDQAQALLETALAAPAPPLALDALAGLADLYLGEGAAAETLRMATFIAAHPGDVCLG